MVMAKSDGQAGATGGCTGYILGELHRLVFLSVNHIGNW
jgi:hypothetical protein